jgi:hypothetical protein
MSSAKRTVQKEQGGDMTIRFIYTALFCALVCAYAALFRAYAALFRVYAALFCAFTG